MGLTVFAQDMGLFHKGSGGKGIGPGDVCLSPPPPPAGPVPVPYVNVAKAGDLSKGSKTVLIDGEPTALEDQSYTSTSSGDEAGTQGGSVITAKTKGKAYFSDWSSTVLIEGKGVCRHGDMMGHNCASNPPACVNAGVYADFCNKVLKDKYGTPCTQEYKGNRVNTTKRQREDVQGGPCWQCGKTRAQLHPTRFHADHQPPLKVAWEAGGCNMEKKPDKFKEWARKQETVAPHCPSCSATQGIFGKMDGNQILRAMGSPKSLFGGVRRSTDRLLHKRSTRTSVKRVIVFVRKRILT